MGTISHHDPQQSSLTEDVDDAHEALSAADEFVDAESREFWRRIHRMSSATYKPTRRGVLAHDWSQVMHHEAPDGRGAEFHGLLDRQGR